MKQEEIDEITIKQETEEDVASGKIGQKRHQTIGAEEGTEEKGEIERVKKEEQETEESTRKEAPGVPGKRIIMNAPPRDMKATPEKMRGLMRHKKRKSMSNASGKMRKLKKAPEVLGEEGAPRLPKREAHSFVKLNLHSDLRRCDR